ncbi:MAG: FAD-dependent oxidoreductase [Chloroflexota bacterium]|nr:FAD-dependent oxidoreductase [Chloroflexota bacterium]
MTLTLPRALRVAIIGSGPSAFYAAEHLQKAAAWDIQIDMFERLPTPYGLVRGGVAPDHPKIKTVAKVYEKIALKPGFRFFGNVEFGSGITHADLSARYHAVIYAVGAQTDRRLGIPGEDLPGSHAATEFVGWYNAHPDYRHLTFDLTQTAAAVIGNGNVAMDVARILASSRAELAATDIADHALDALAVSRVTDIYILGRRGIAQAAFTNPELKELGVLTDADVIVQPGADVLDPLSADLLARTADRDAIKNVTTLASYAAQSPQGKPKRLHLHFLVSPVRLIGTDRVEAIELAQNELIAAEDGSLRPRTTDRAITIPIGLVFRSIGYHGVALSGVPFDARGGVIPNIEGRVIGADGIPHPGEYVVGWIKRGPSGIIGTNKPDSQATVERLLADADAGMLPMPTSVDDAADLLARGGCDVVTFADWQALDALELARGAAVGRPRVKYASIDVMMAAIADARLHAPRTDS